MIRKEMATANSRSRAHVETVSGVDAGLASFFPQGLGFQCLLDQPKAKNFNLISFYLNPISLSRRRLAQSIQKLSSAAAPCRLKRIAGASESAFPQDSEKCTKLHPTFYASCILYRSSRACSAASKPAGSTRRTGDDLYRRLSRSVSAAGFECGPALGSTIRSLNPFPDRRAACAPLATSRHRALRSPCCHAYWSDTRALRYFLGLGVWRIGFGPRCTPSGSPICSRSCLPSR